MSAPAYVVFPIAPYCQGNGGRCRFRAEGARTRDAEVALIDPEGEVNPGGWYCRPHGEGIVDEYLRVLGEEWTLVPIVKEAPRDRLS